MKDLNNLLALLKPKAFRAKKVCVLNPTFGRASELVGGADADLVLDDTLVEIKAVKNLEFDRRMFNQLMGYYLLSRIGGIDGCPRRHRLKTLAVYYARFGVLHRTGISSVVSEKKLREFIPWFKETVARHTETG